MSMERIGKQESPLTKMEIIFIISSLGSVLAALQYLLNAAI